MNRGIRSFLSRVTSWNATSATIAWRNDTMSADAVVPMTNLTQANGTAWVYAGYLPAQATPKDTRTALVKALQPRTAARIAIVDKALKDAGLLN